MFKKIKYFPKLKKGWKKGRGDIIYENPQYGRIQAVVNSTKIKHYDTIIWIEPTGSGIVVMFNEKKRIYLHQEKRPAVARKKTNIRPGKLSVDLSNLGMNSLEVPRGFYDKKDKNSKTCIIREIEEETGIKIIEKNLKKIGEINPNTSYFTSNISVYIARVSNSIKKDLDKEEKEKISNGQWYSVLEIKRMIREKKIFCAMTLSALNIAFCVENL